VNELSVQIVANALTVVNVMTVANEGSAVTALNVENVAIVLIARIMKEANHLGVFVENQPIYLHRHVLLVAVLLLPAKVTNGVAVELVGVELVLDDEKNVTVKLEVVVAAAVEAIGVMLHAPNAIIERIATIGISVKIAIVVMVVNVIKGAIVVMVANVNNVVTVAIVINVVMVAIVINVVMEAIVINVVIVVMAVSVVSAVVAAERILAIGEQSDHHLANHVNHAKKRKDLPRKELIPKKKKTKVPTMANGLTLSVVE